MIQQFNDYLKDQFFFIQFYSSEDMNEILQARNMIRVNAFCAVFHEVCGQVESNSVRQLLQFNGKFHGIMLCGNVPWLWHDFLQRNATSLLKPYEKLITDLLRKERNIYVQSGNHSLLQETRAYILRAIRWTLEMNIVIRYLKNDNIQMKRGYREYLERHASGVRLFVEAIDLMGSMSFLIKAMINSHETQQIPMTKQNLKIVGKLIQVIRTIRDYFHQRDKEISELTHVVLLYCKNRAVQMIKKCKVN